MNRIRGAAALALLSLVSAGCAAILVGDEPKPLASSLCVCDLPGLEPGECESHFVERVEAAPAEVREAYLKHYEGAGCTDPEMRCDRRLEECFGVRPACLEEGETCTSSLLCCDESPDGEALGCCAVGNEVACCGACKDYDEMVEVFASDLEAAVTEESDERCVRRLADALEVRRGEALCVEARCAFECAADKSRAGGSCLSLCRCVRLAEPGGPRACLECLLEGCETDGCDLSP